MYLAYVVGVKEYDGESSPVPGAIRVACPQIWGFQDGIDASLSDLEKLQYCNVSPWIFPLTESTEDIVYPDIGDPVAIELLIGSGVYFWRSTIKFLQSTDSPFLDNVTVGPTVYSENTDDYKTRVIGTKDGSAIIFFDSWKKDNTTSDGTRNSKFKIIVGGANFSNDSRSGVELSIDATSDSEIVSILVQDKDAKRSQSIVIDNTKDSENIIITDKAGQTITMSSKSGEEGVTIEDQAGQVFNMNAASGSESVSVKLSDSVGVSLKKDGSEIKLNNSSTQGITITPDTTTIQHSSTQSITMSASAITIQGALGKMEIL